MITNQWRNCDDLCLGCYMWGTFKSLQDFMRFLIRWLLLLTILL